MIMKMIPVACFLALLQMTVATDYLEKVRAETDKPMDFQALLKAWQNHAKENSGPWSRSPKELASATPQAEASPEEYQEPEEISPAPVTAPAVPPSGIWSIFQQLPLIQKLAGMFGGATTANAVTAAVEPKARVGLLSCIRCRREFPSNFEFEKHLQQCSKAKPKFCKFCNKMYPSKNKFRQHKADGTHISAKEAWLNAHPQPLRFSQKIQRVCPCYDTAMQQRAKKCRFYTTQIASALYKELQKPDVSPQKLNQEMANDIAKKAYDTVTNVAEFNAIDEIPHKILMDKNLPSEPATAFSTINARALSGGITKALAYPVVFIEIPNSNHFSVYVRVNSTHGFYLDAHTSKKHYEILSNKPTKRKQKRYGAGYFQYKPRTELEAGLKKKLPGRITFTCFGEPEHESS